MRTIAYWATTILIALAFLAGGCFDIAQPEQVAGRVALADFLQVRPELVVNLERRVLDVIVFEVGKADTKHDSNDRG